MRSQAEVDEAAEHILAVHKKIMDDRNRIMRRQCEAMELKSQTMAEFAKSQKDALDEIRPAEPQRDSADAERPARSDV